MEINRSKPGSVPRHLAACSSQRIKLASIRIWRNEATHQVRSSRKYSVTRCYFVLRGDCRMFAPRNAIRFPRRIPVTATRFVQKATCP